MPGPEEGTIPWLTPRPPSAAGARSASGAWQPSEGYPDPAVEILDRRFERYRLFNAAVERLATGMRWCEGPVWFRDGR